MRAGPSHAAKIQRTMAAVAALRQAFPQPTRTAPAASGAKWPASPGPPASRTAAGATCRLLLAWRPRPAAGQAARHPSPATAQRGGEAARRRGGHPPRRALDRTPGPEAAMFLDQAARRISWVGTPSVGRVSKQPKTYPGQGGWSSMQAPGMSWSLACGSRRRSRGGCLPPRRWERRRLPGRARRRRRATSACSRAGRAAATSTAAGSARAAAGIGRAKPWER